MIEMLLFNKAALNLSQQPIGAELKSYGGVLAYKGESFALIIPETPLYPNSDTHANALRRAGATTHAGFSDWGLPSLEEGRLILDKGRLISDRLNSGSLPKQYWSTATANVDGKVMANSLKLLADYKIEIAFDDPTTVRFFFPVRRIEL